MKKRPPRRPLLQLMMTLAEFSTITTAVTAMVTPATVTAEMPLRSSRSHPTSRILRSPARAAILWSGLSLMAAPHPAVLLCVHRGAVRSLPNISPISHSTSSVSHLLVKPNADNDPDRSANLVIADGARLVEHVELNRNRNHTVTSPRLFQIAIGLLRFERPFPVTLMTFQQHACSFEPELHLHRVAAILLNDGGEMRHSNADERLHRDEER